MGVVGKESSLARTACWSQLTTTNALVVARAVRQGDPPPRRRSAAGIGFLSLALSEAPLVKRKAKKPDDPIQALLPVDSPIEDRTESRYDWNASPNPHPFEPVSCSIRISG